MTEEINSIKQFFKEINEIPLLSKEEERKLCIEIKNGSLSAK